MAALAPLFAKWLPTQSAKIDVADEGGGFVSAFGMEEVDLAPSGSRWTDPDLRRFETKSGARGQFTWSA